MACMWCTVSVDVEARRLLSITTYSWYKRVSNEYSTNDERASLLALPSPWQRRLQSSRFPQIFLDPNLHPLQDIHIRPPLVRIHAFVDPITTPDAPRPHHSRHQHIRPQSIPNNRDLIRARHHPALSKPIHHLLPTKRLLLAALGQSEDGNPQG